MKGHGCQKACFLNPKVWQKTRILDSCDEKMYKLWLNDLLIALFTYDANIAVLANILLSKPEMLKLDLNSDWLFSCFSHYL